MDNKLKHIEGVEGTIRASTVSSGVAIRFLMMEEVLYERLQAIGEETTIRSHAFVHFLEARFLQHFADFNWMLVVKSSNPWTKA